LLSTSNTTSFIAYASVIGVPSGRSSGDLPQAAVVGADAELFFGAAHAVRFEPAILAQVISMPPTLPPSRAKATVMPSRTFGAPQTQS
jgi:hypothetical protein